MDKLIYIADDEDNILMLMKTFLENEGFRIETFSDGASVKKAFEEKVPDLVILDVMMPGCDGLTLCSEFRRKSKVPIMIVSAKDTTLDKVTGLTLGCDDYLAKPFLPLEMVARVKALLRRAEMVDDDQVNDRVYICGNMRIEFGPRRVYIADSYFSVTPMEYEFLSFLIKNGEAAVSKTDLLKVIWDYEDMRDSRVIDDLVKRLRKKLREAGSDAIIETVWGYGYRLCKRSNLIAEI